MPVKNHPTLRYADGVRRIKNQPVVNQDRNGDSSVAESEQYSQQLKSVKEEIKLLTEELHFSSETILNECKKQQQIKKGLEEMQVFA